MFKRIKLQKYTLIFVLCSIVMHDSYAVIITEGQKIKKNKNYPKEMLVLEFMRSRFFVPSLLASVTAITNISILKFGKEVQENLFSLNEYIFFLAMSRMLGICVYEIYNSDKRDFYASQRCYKLMHPKSKILISTELFEVLYNNRAKAKSWFLSPENYSRLDEYYSVFQERGLPHEITEQILLLAGIISSDKDAPLKKTLVKTKQFIKLLKYAELKPWAYDQKQARIIFYQKSKIKYFIDTEDIAVLRELHKNNSNFYDLIKIGWIHQNTIKNSQQLLFDSRFIDTEKEVADKKIHPKYYSKFGFRFYEVKNSDEKKDSLSIADFYKFHEDPHYINKFRNQLKTKNIWPGCKKSSVEKQMQNRCFTLPSYLKE